MTTPGCVRLTRRRGRWLWVKNDCHHRICARLFLSRHVPPADFAYCFRNKRAGIMADDGIALVLRRLVRFGCHPRRVGDAAWEAQCPVHRGPYYALLVSRGPDGSVSLNCRYRDFMGRFCPTSELWDSIGLDPREFAGIQVENDPSEGASDAHGEPAPATNGHGGAPSRDAPLHAPVNHPSFTEGSPESSSVDVAQALAGNECRLSFRERMILRGAKDVSPESHSQPATPPGSPSPADAGKHQPPGPCLRGRCRGPGLDRAGVGSGRRWWRWRPDSAAG